MIDSHCHLDHAPLFENLQDVINRAKSVGVNKFLTICTSIKSFGNIKKIILNYKDVFGTVGIHPHETKLHKDISKRSLISFKVRRFPNTSRGHGLQKNTKFPTFKLENHWSKVWHARSLKLNWFFAAFIF